MALTQIKASNITDGTVVAAEIASNAITTVKIADDAVTTAKIPDDAVTAAKIHDAVELGGPSLGTSSVIRTNANTISEDITFSANTIKSVCHSVRSMFRVLRAYINLGMADHHE